MEFVSLQDLVQKLGIKTGDQLLISSDIKTHVPRHAKEPY